MFDNLFYPDNEKRAVRLTELVSDNSTAVGNISQQQTKYEIAINNANEAIRQAYKVVGTPVKFHDIDFVPESKTHKILISVADVITPMLTYGIANKALSFAAKSYLLQQGRIGEAAFIKLVGLPKWFKVGTVFGSITAVVLVQSIIDSVTGAVQRKNLQDKIKESVDPRFQLKKAELTNEITISKLNVVTTSVSVVLSALGPNVSKEQINKIIDNSIKRNQVELKNIDSLTKTTLDALDKSRGSWTNED